MPQTLDYDHAVAAVPAPAPPLPELKDEKPNGRVPWIWIAALSLLLVVVAVTGRTLLKPDAPQYITAPVQRGDISRTISATGKVQAVTTVQVGTQVSGTVSQILVDYNSPVKKGQIIAQLDQDQLQAQLTQARASLLSAQMGVQTATANVAGMQSAIEAAQANVDRLQSAVDDAQLNFNRTQELYNDKLVATRDLETARATLNQALAQKQQGVAQLNQAKTQVAGARSQVAQAQAQAAQAQAQVTAAAANLDKTIIRAPIDGVIVARSVDPGQTVAASFNTPTLFLIANDLTHMQVLADIDEADVGQLTTDSKVTFTVDAFPTETFEGRIAQIRLSPQTVQNVTTYTAVINVDNPNGKLLPGMTANVTATTAHAENVLTIPNAALRFRPADVARPTNGGTQQVHARTNGGNSGTTIWRVAGSGKLEPVRATLGITNGTATEVTGGDLHEGDLVATASLQSGDNKQQAQSGATKSPFGMGGAARGGRR